MKRLCLSSIALVVSLFLLASTITSSNIPEYLEAYNTSSGMPIETVQPTSQDSQTETVISEPEQSEPSQPSQSETQISSPMTVQSTIEIPSAAVPKTPPPFTWDKGGNYSGEITIREASAPGIEVKTNPGAAVDYSNVNDGYVMVKKHTDIKTKVRITGPGGEICDRYTLNEIGRYYPIPLQFGDSAYIVDVFTHIEGISYVQIMAIQIFADFNEPDINLLQPGIYANYIRNSAAVKKAFDLCLNAKNNLQKIQSIYGYITENIKYSQNDKNTKMGYIPNVDSVLAAKKGSCFDFASLMTVMLRAQGIKTRLVFGNAKGVSHAWVEVYIENSGIIAEGISSNGGWKRLDPTYGVNMSPEKIEKAQYEQTIFF